MQYCVSRDNALRGGGGGSAVLRITGQCPEGGQCSIAYHGTMPRRGAFAVLRITGQCPEGGAVQYCVSRDNALRRAGQCSIAYHGTMP